MSNTVLLPHGGWRPRPYQVKPWEALIDPNLKRITLVLHRRAGKDELALHCITVRAMRKPAAYAYLLPTQVQADRVVFNAINHRTGQRRIFDAIPEALITKLDEQKMQISLESGSVISFLGSDNIDRLMGTGFDTVVYSEASLTDPRAFAMMRPVILESGGAEVFIGTPRGKQNAFHNIYQSSKADMEAGRPGVYAFYMPASVTKAFTTEELNQMRIDMQREHGSSVGESLFRQEMECDWNAAVQGAVFAQEMLEMEDEKRVRPLQVDPRIPVHTSVDLGIADDSVWCFWQRHGNMHRLVDGITVNGIGLEQHVQLLRDWAHKNKAFFGSMYAPHDAAQRELGGRGLSRMDQARNLGLIWKHTPQTRLKTQIAVASQLFRMTEVNSESEGAMHILEAWKAYRWTTNKATGQRLETPVHDWASHATSSAMTYAVNMAKELGVRMDYTDEILSGGRHDPINGGGKFDPRQFGKDAPFGHANNVSGIMRAHAGGQPTRGAFG